MAMPLNFLNSTPETFETDTSQGAGRRRPRHREPLSCSQCRDRKVKCDRKQPCKQCLNRGHSNSCCYGSSKDQFNYGNNNATPNGHHQQHNMTLHKKAQTEPSSPLSTTSAESDLRKRMDRLENLYFASSTSKPIKQEERKASVDMPPSTLPTHVVKVKNLVHTSAGSPLSAKTRFVGGTHWLAVCNTMTVLKAMMNKSAEFAASHDSFAEIKAWTKSVNSVPLPLSFPTHDASALIGLLPLRQNCDMWIRAYNATYRQVHDIVDDYNLHTAMTTLWKQPPYEDATMVCIVLLIVAIGMQTDENERLNGRRLGRHVEYFAYTSNLLHKPCVGSMKVLLLLTVLKTIACSDTESLDSLSGTIGLTSQVAMSMGLHRSPEAIGHLTPYQSEVRRRLWAVFFRLYFEHCMRTGIPFPIRAEDTDAGLPSNVDLREIAPDAGGEFNEKELPIETDATFSIIAAQLAYIAAPIQRAISSAGGFVPAETVKQLADSFNHLIADAPAYMRPGAKTSDPNEDIQQAFLTVTMHSISLVPSVCIVLNAPPDPSQKTHLLSVWDHSLSVMHTFQVLSKKSQQIQTIAYQLLWSDACRAAFSAAMVLNRLSAIEARSIMGAAPQHTLIPFQDTLVKHLTFMSRFWFQSAHLGPVAAKNCMFLAVVHAVTSKLFSEENGTSEKVLIEVGARSVEQTIELMKASISRRHQTFPLSPNPSMSSTSDRVISSRSVSSPNLAGSWQTTPGATDTQASSLTRPLVDASYPSYVNTYTHPFIPPDGHNTAYPREPWSIEDFEYGHAGSIPGLHGPEKLGGTYPAYIEGLISPATDWSTTSQWIEDMSMIH